MGAAAALADAIATLDARFGARAVTTAARAAEHTGARRFLTGTAFDRLTGGIAPGSALALVGEGTCGKVTTALRAVAGAQAEGATAMWIDGGRSFDPLAARRCDIDLRRVIVVRPRAADAVLAAAGAALRSVGFRIVVVDLGPSFAPITSIDGLTPLLPQARGSTSALVIVADAPPVRVRVPTFVFERAGWEQRHGRTSGWTFAVRPAGGAADDAATLKVAV